MTSRPQEPPQGGQDLEELVLQGDLDAVLRRVAVAEIASAWCRYSVQSRERTEDTHEDPDWWAVSFAIEAALTRHPILRTLLLELLDAAPDEAVVASIGAGPLEDFVSDDEDDLAWLEAHVATTPNMPRAVAGTWVAGRVSPSTLARLDRLAGVPLARPRPREEWPDELVELDAATRDVADALDPSTALDVADFAAAVDRFLAAARGFPGLGVDERDDT
jgi:hypothetical protein